MTKLTCYENLNSGKLSSGKRPGARALPNLRTSSLLILLSPVIEN